MTAKVEHEVGEAAARLWVALHDVLKPLDDRSTAELDVSLDEAAPIPRDSHGSVDQQRWRLESFDRSGGGVQFPGVEHRTVARRRTRQAHRGRLVVAVVADVAMVQIELVVPRVGYVSSFPWAGPQTDYRPAGVVRCPDHGGGVDARLEHQPRHITNIGWGSDEVVVEEAIQFDLGPDGALGVAQDLVHRYQACGTHPRIMPDLLSHVVPGSSTPAASRAQEEGSR